MEIGRIGIGTVITYFIIYIVTHIVISLYSEHLKKEVKEKPGNKELEGQNKLFIALMKWFPAIYVIMLLLIFYIQ